MQEPPDIDAADVSLEDIDKYTLALPDVVEYPDHLEVTDIDDCDGEGDAA